jgi:hypothetical protein
MRNFKEIMYIGFVALALILGVNGAGYAYEQGDVGPGFEWETVAASQTDQMMGATGAAGDYLDHLIIVVSTAATAAVSIEDGDTNIAVFPNSPGGGVGTYIVPVNLKSLVGGWEITTGAGAAVIAVGRFK